MKLLKFEPRKEVMEQPINADTILLRMYRREIGKLYCIDCTEKKCSLRGTGYCFPPVKTSIIGTS